MIHCRRGFTMVEILIVIGVMMLLMGIGVIAYRGLDKVASERATHVMLDDLSGMLAEYEHGGQIGDVPRSYSDATAKAGDFAPIDTTAGVWDVSSNAGGRRDATIGDDATAVERLARMPANRAVLRRLTDKQMLGCPAGADPIKRPDLRAIADGWRNPVLLAPVGGVRVFVNGTPQTITSPDHRAFWFSAGPDGDFSKGDDNVYSFAK